MLYATWLCRNAGTWTEREQVQMSLNRSREGWWKWSQCRVFCRMDFTEVYWCRVHKINSEYEKSSFTSTCSPEFGSRSTWHQYQNSVWSHCRLFTNQHINTTQCWFFLLVLLLLEIGDHEILSTVWSLRTKPLALVYFFKLFYSQLRMGTCVDV